MDACCHMHRNNDPCGPITMSDSSLLSLYEMMNNGRARKQERPRNRMHNEQQVSGHLTASYAREINYYEMNVFFLQCVHAILQIWDIIRACFMTRFKLEEKMVSS